MGQATPPDAVNGILGTATGIAAGAEHTLAIVGGGGRVSKLPRRPDEKHLGKCAHLPRSGAAGVPFSVLTAVLGAAICRSTPLYAGR